MSGRQVLQVHVGQCLHCMHCVDEIITREMKVGRAAPEVLPGDEKGDGEHLPGGEPSHRAHYRDSLGLQNQNDVLHNNRNDQEWHDHTSKKREG